MQRTLSAAVLFGLVLATPTSAGERIGAFVVPDEGNAIVLSGQIGLSTPMDLRTALRRHPNIDLVVLSSPGGVVDTGLILADDIARLGLDTYIPAGSGCYSACAYAFLAGSARASDGELGVHQFSAPSSVEDMGATQVAVSGILDMLSDFDTPDEIVDRMLTTPSNEMHVFSSADLVELGVERDGASVRARMPVASTTAAAPIRGTMTIEPGVEKALGVDTVAMLDMGFRQVMALALENGVELNMSFVEE